jgi:RNA 2',3'-cyclic 3'-phosphodiesterase
MSHRPKLFTGIELDAPVRAWCSDIAARLQACALPGRFETPEKLHITVAFLGWVDPEQVEPIRDVMRSAAVQVEPFTLTLDRIGAFPHERRPRIVWIGSTDQGEPFRSLAGAMQSGYNELGFTFDKAPVAHVTLARIKEGRAHLPMLDVKPVRLRVNHVTLFESIPAGRTTRYEVRDRAWLAQ